MAGMNSPVSTPDNSDNQEINDFDIFQLKKSVGLKSIQPTISPSMIKSTATNSQTRPRSEKTS